MSKRLFVSLLLLFSSEAVSQSYYCEPEYSSIMGWDSDSDQWVSVGTEYGDTRFILERDGSSYSLRVRNDELVLSRCDEVSFTGVPNAIVCDGLWDFDLNLDTKTFVAGLLRQNIDRDLLIANKRDRKVSVQTHIGMCFKVSTSE